MQKQQQWRIRQRGSSNGGGGSVSSSSRTGRARNRGRQLAGGRLDGGSFNQDGHPRTTLFVPGQTQHNLLIYALVKLTLSHSLAFRATGGCHWHRATAGVKGSPAYGTWSAVQSHNIASVAITWQPSARGLQTTLGQSSVHSLLTTAFLWV